MPGMLGKVRHDDQLYINIKYKLEYILELVSESIDKVYDNVFLTKLTFYRQIFWEVIQATPVVDIREIPKFVKRHWL